MNVSNVKLIKSKKNLLCFTYIENQVQYFAKVFFINDDEKLYQEYHREKKMNQYILDNIKDFTYFTRLLKIYENVSPFQYFSSFIKNKYDKCNIFIFEHSGNHTLRYYINKISLQSFHDVLDQLKYATNILESINLIHYDLYCETNIMLIKKDKKWILKIIDLGLSYIDDTDKSKLDYKTALESISYYNKRFHLIPEN